MTKDLGNFIIKCSRCFSNGFPSHTTLYVNWEQRFYVIACQECRTSEIFLEDGTRLNLFNEKETVFKIAGEDDVKKDTVVTGDDTYNTYKVNGSEDI